MLDRKTVVLAVEEGKDEIIINGLREIGFRNEEEWDFFPVNHSDLLNGVSNPDVLVLSIKLRGGKPNEILKYVKNNFPSTHIVLLIEENSEQSKNYIRLAKSMGLKNIVTGELPGTLPYTLDLAINYTIGEVKGGENEPIVETAKEDIKENDKELFLNSLKKEEVGINSRKQGFIIASTGAKGGIGKTSVAAGTTLALARNGLAVTAVDYDYSRQDLTAFFKVPDFQRIDRDNFNANEIKRSITMVKDNIYLLPAVGEKVPLEFPSADEVRFTLYTLRETNPIVIVDTPSDINCHHVPVVLQEADLILVTIDQTTFSDQDVFDYGSFLLNTGIDPNKVRIVVNRYSRRLRPTREMIRLFNQGIRGNASILTTIPNDWEAYANLSHQGEIPRVKDKKSPWQIIVNEIGTHVDLPQKNNKFRLRKEA